MLPFIIGGVSAVSSLLGDAIERNNAEEERDRAVQAFTKLLIPTADTTRRADQTGDTVYTKAMGDLNAGAFTARGALNPDVLRTIAFSKMTTGRAMAENEVVQQDFAYNRGIQEKIAQIESMPLPSVNPMKAITEGVSGYFAGRQLDMAESLVDAQTDYLNELGKSNTKTFDKTIDIMGSTTPSSINQPLKRYNTYGKLEPPNKKYRKPKQPWEE